MGSNEFTTAKTCGEKVYKQLAKLKEITHPKTGQTLSLLKRTTADGKARWTSTGSSRACSYYPIPEAPDWSTGRHESPLREAPVYKLIDTPGSI